VRGGVRAAQHDPNEWREPVHTPSGERKRENARRPFTCSSAQFGYSPLRGRRSSLAPRSPSPVSISCPVFLPLQNHFLLRGDVLSPGPSLAFPPQTKPPPPHTHPSPHVRQDKHLSALSVQYFIAGERDVLFTAPKNTGAGEQRSRGHGREIQRKGNHCDARRLRVCVCVCVCRSGWCPYELSHSLFMTAPR